MDNQKNNSEVLKNTADSHENINDTGVCAMSADEVRQLMMELNHCQTELAESKNAYLRAHADFDNFRKRLRSERDQEFSRGSDRVLADLLPVVDDFERALSVASDGGASDCLTQGVGLIYRSLLNLLERYNIRPMEVDGKPFDPKYHDAVAKVATRDVHEHTIIGVVQRGYFKNSDVFRPAKVAVAVTPEQVE
jgi:molecular chaperone GrpE